MLDRASCGDDPAPLVEAVVEAGVDWVQVRDRSLEGASLLEFTDAVCDASRRGCARRGGTARVLVNRRADVALAAGADGVHLGFDGMDPADARALLGDAALIGVSTHAAREIDPSGGASYAHLAPIAPPLSKAPTRPALGWAALREACTRGLPVLAQGGIDEGSASAALRAGAAGVAVTGAILQGGDPARRARALREALDA